MLWPARILNATGRGHGKRCYTAAFAEEDGMAKDIVASGPAERKEWSPPRFERLDRTVADDTAAGAFLGATEGAHIPTPTYYSAPAYS